MKYKTPEGQIYTLYADMLRQPHLLIAGATGSGKSVVINGLIYTSLYHSPAAVQFILIDPKRVELVDFSQLPHVLQYASEPGAMVQALQYAMNTTESRYKEMQRQHVKRYAGGAVYVVIDELADLMTTNKKQIQPLLQRLCQIGRAANVHIIAATQCPLTCVIPTAIKVNFDSRLGLRTACKQDSRNILGVTGCECLPDPITEKRAQGYYRKATGTVLYNIPMTPPDEIQRIIDHWKPRHRWRR